MNNGFSLNLVQSAQPYIPFYKKIIMIFDLLQQKYSKTSLICPKELLTSNRKDIEYRIQFLKEVLEKKTLPKNTLYYQFISDDEKNVILDGEKVSKDFISLYNSIKKNSICEPIAIGRYSSKKIKTRYFENGVKKWKNIPNETGYQVINGAHRLAVALFLGFEKIPVKIYRSMSFEIPNYTDYIEIKEFEYLKRINQN